MIFVIIDNSLIGSHSVSFLVHTIIRSLNSSNNYVVRGTKNGSDDGQHKFRAELMNQVFQNLNQIKNSTTDVQH